MQPFDEVLYYGSGELKAVGLAHAIILGIAVWRYAVRPWLLRRREASARSA